MTILALQAAVSTHTGLVRSHNEDSVYASPRLVAVADGVGGAAAGEVASAAVIDQLILLDKCRLQESLATALERAISSGNASVGFIADCRPEMTGMSTTVTAVAIGDGAYAIGNLGDSRAYLLRDGSLTQLTRDDSYVQELIDGGKLDKEAARTHPQRSVVTAALDGQADRRPAIATVAARAADRLLLCSDGLTDLVEETEVEAALAIRSREASARRLVDLALAAGGKDNVSVIVADVGVSDDASAAWITAADYSGGV